MLLVCIKIQPIAPIYDVRSDFGLEALDALYGPARSVIMGERGASGNVA